MNGAGKESIARRGLISDEKFLCPPKKAITMLIFQLKLLKGDGFYVFCCLRGEKSWARDCKLKS
jgi:hypothetical protein